MREGDDRIEELEDELSTAHDKIDQMSGQLDDVEAELEELRLDDFREQVREKLGLHWDARDDQLLAAIRRTDV